MDEGCIDGSGNVAACVLMCSVLRCGVSYSGDVFALFVVVIVLGCLACLLTQANPRFGEMIELLRQQWAATDSRKSGSRRVVPKYLPRSRPASCKHPVFHSEATELQPQAALGPSGGVGKLRSGSSGGVAVARQGVKKVIGFPRP